MMRRSPGAEGSRAESGFTLVELTIALFVTVEVILAVLLLFDFSSKLTRVQSNVTDMQQSLRIAQYDTVRLVRMAGRGGLPEGTSPVALSAGYLGAAVAVQNNVASGTHISDSTSPTVVAGTDVLTIRGVFSSPVYHPLSMTLDHPTTPNLSTRGTIVVKSVIPVDPLAAADAVVTQDLTPLVTAINSGIPEALIITGADDSVYAVVELDPGTSSTGVAGQVTVGFKITGDANAVAFSGLSAGGSFPAALNAIWTVGILEEYRYYVREDYAIPGNTTSDLIPKLSRAHVLPNTNVAWGSGTATANATNLMLDIADNVTDLQVALGFDLNGDGQVTDANSSTDEWLYNVPADAAGNVGNWNGKPLDYVRLNTLVRTDRRDFQYTAPLLVSIEDRLYGASSPYNDPTTATHNRMFRRRLLQTIIDLRNL